MDNNKDSDNNQSSNQSKEGRLLPASIQSTLQYFDFEGMSNQEIIEKYEETLLHRELQIKQLSNAIGVLNEKIVHATECNTLLFEEIDKLKKENATKDIVLGKELKNKELMFEQINTLTQEHMRMKKVLKTYEQIIQDHNKDDDDDETAKEGNQTKGGNSDNEINNSNENNKMTNEAMKQPKEIEINPSKNIDSYFGRVMDRLIGAYENYVTGDEEKGETEDANANEGNDENNDSNNEQENADTKKDNEKDDDDKIKQDKDISNENKLQLNNENKEIKIETNDNNNSTAKELINNVDIKAEIKKENIISEKKEKDQQQPEMIKEVVKIDITKEESEIKLNTNQIEAKTQDNKTEVININNISKEQLQNKEETVEQLAINLGKNDIEQKAQIQQIETVKDDIKLLENIISQSNEMNTKSEVLSTPPTETNSFIETTKENEQLKDSPQPINATNQQQQEKSPIMPNKEEPELKQEEKKATTKKKKTKKKPKGLSTQSLGSDNITYEPFFK